ncbi:hypothetical protein C9926_02055 [Sulfurovum lithotrophicum]|nr:hypothetical protein C9926_02055 [Sulfurovum lithotrophicum]
MQMVKKSAGIVFAIWLSLLVFMPKAEIYYMLEKKLLTQDITLNERSIEEGIFSLSVNNVTVYVKGIALASIEELDFFTLLFYNTLDIKELEIDEALHSKVPAKIQEAHVVQHILAPTTLALDANGSFGIITGKINILDKQVHIDFVKTKEIGMIQPYLQKNEKGWFYEKTF